MSLTPTPVFRAIVTDMDIRVAEIITAIITVMTIMVIITAITITMVITMVGKIFQCTYNAVLTHLKKKYKHEKLLRSEKKRV